MNTHLDTSESEFEYPTDTNESGVMNTKLDTSSIMVKIQKRVGICITNMRA